ncbi:DUF2314 domain-containing protein [Mesorhizobium sp. M1393]|uniref:YegJ family protein n=1 Tax=unclassified Mesorhizobium TaxID=325217 RepID=UPI00333721E0
MPDDRGVLVKVEGRRPMNLPTRTMLSVMLALVPASARAQSPDQGGDRLLTVGPDDPEMAAAIEQARASLDQFLTLSETPPPGTARFKLKVVVEDGNAAEHFWVIPFHRTATGFAGTLANEPQAVRNVVNGQDIEFTRDDISDWGYTKNGRQVGSFTVCVMLKKMPREDVDSLRNN